MKYIIVVKIIILYFGFSTNLQAQGEYAVPFLNYDLSPKLNGMAGTFTGLPTTEVYGAYFNPAQIGVFSQQYNFAVGFYPQKTDWLPGANWSDLTLYANAILLGYKLNTELPVSVGFSYIYTKFNLGKNVWTDASGNELGEFNSYESCNAFTVGASTEYYLKYYFGISYKYIYSRLVPIKVKQLDGIAEVSAFDIGVIISAPISDFILPEELKNINNFLPILDLSIGYSVLNLGDEVFYGDINQGDPLPRQARFGYGASFGLDYNYNDKTISILKFDFSSEARDLLAYRESENIKYKSMFGDIKFFDNVIRGKTSDEVVIHKGWRINVFNTFTYSEGKIKGDGFHLFDKSNGYSISTKGIFDWLINETQITTFVYIANHFSLEYSWSKYDSESEYLDNTEFYDIQLKIFGYW